MGSVTINDVAALAGVSTKTVSRVLNREPHVRPELRDRVAEAVRSLNYQPNVAARALAGSRAYLLGLCYDNPSPGYVSAVQVGALSACREAGYHLLIEQIDSQAGARQLEALLQAVKMDGLILSPPVCDRAALLDLLEARRMPFVRITPAGQFDRGPYVHMDDRKAAYDMTRLLQDLGHRRIGFVRGPLDHSAAPLRQQGFLDAMGDGGLPVRPEWIVSGNFSFRSGVGAAERLLNLPDRPTAVFASNDDMALGVLAAASRMGLALPDQLSVAGFDDSPIAQVVWPQLTTIRQPVEKMAFEAAAMLIHGLGHAQAMTARLLDFELIVRDSTAPPQA
ncbi:MAG: LacI family DNA-binding transcriptional regulator [Caulobacteraceae bacterium]